MPGALLRRSVRIVRTVNPGLIMRRNVSKDFGKEYAHLLEGNLDQATLTGGMVGRSMTAPAGMSVTRKQTVMEKEVGKRKDAAASFLKSVPDEDHLPEVETYMPPTLQDAIFVGHLVTDLDSIAGSIGAAELYGKLTKGRRCGLWKNANTVRPPSS
jgi:hypothetical protein